MGNQQLTYHAVAPREPRAVYRSDLRFKTKTFAAAADEVAVKRCRAFRSKAL